MAIYGDYGGAVKAAREYEGMSNGVSNDAKRVPELVEQLGRLERSISFADEVITRLRDRLDGGALRPQMPQPTSGEKLTVASPSSPHANTLHSLTARLDGVTERVTDLLQRLEV